MFPHSLLICTCHKISAFVLYTNKSSSFAASLPILSTPDLTSITTAKQLELGCAGRGLQWPNNNNPIR